MPEVHMTYSDFLNSVTDEISFELLTDVVLKLKCDPNFEGLIMGMKDKITENVGLCGRLDLDRLNTLIKILTIFRNQIENHQGGKKCI